MSLRTELAQTVGQLTSQADAQRSGFREQIRHLQDEHRTTVETLQNQMTRLENQLFTLQSQTAPVQTSRKPVVDRRTVDQGAMGGLGLGLSDQFDLSGPHWLTVERPKESKFITTSAHVTTATKPHTRYGQHGLRRLNTRHSPAD
ncbi:GRIP and coiled-coil domain-containing protein 2-like [Salvelinus sp. IW2-2015]|uniref:GRIP and coiled-coil domain-containing protein 2-like n=1 Tax=Salvelinus sp. IW2-2015 TaxID=2691554 RepID=UPI000CEA7D93|nr:GRIP and coiled-coil domain-containing protein 2-like [Salvelinus alpinus]